MMKPLALAALLLVLLTLLAVAEARGATATSPQPGASSPTPRMTSELTPIRAVRLAPNGPQPFITLLCKFADAADEPVAPTYVDGLFGATYPGLGDYWREVSYGRISLTGSRSAGWYTLPRPESAYLLERGGVALDLLLKDCMEAAGADVHFPDFVGANLVFNRALDNVARGGEVWLQVDGQELRYGVTWLWPHLAMEHDVVAHEMGHAFGLKHSAAGYDRIYGNPWDVMSASSACAPDATYGALAPHIIAYDKDLLGWVPADKKWVADPHDTTTVELAALADATTTGYLLAQVPVADGSGRFYTVEARRRTGYDRALPADAVIIHEVDPRRDPPAVLVNHGRDRDTRVSAGMWAPGEVFVDSPGGVAVAVDRATPTGFVITVSTGVRPWPLGPASTETVPAGEVTLAWQAVEGAAGYEVRVTRDLRPPVNQWLGASTASSATLMLPPGQYRWQVRALPDGAWTPSIGLRTGFAGRRWQPSEIAASFVGPAHSHLAITTDLASGLLLAWAAATYSPVTPWAVSLARPSVSGWRVGEFPVPDSERRGDRLPRVLLGSQGAGCSTMSGAPSTADRQPTSGSDRGDDWVWIESSTLTPDAADGRARFVTGTLTMQGWLDGLVQADREVVAETGNLPIPNVVCAVDAQGDTQVVWAGNRDSGAGIFAATRQANGDWGPVVRMSGSDMDNYTGPAIAVDKQGAFYAAWQHLTGCAEEATTADIEFAWRPAGGSWQPPVVVTRDIGDSHASAPAIAAGSDGAVYLVWEELVAGRYRLFSSYRPADGVWESKMMVPASAAGYWEPTEPALVVDAKDNAYVAWFERRDDLVAVRVSAAVR